MITNDYIFTTHAKKRFNQHFFHLKKENEVKNLSFCNKDEVSAMHKTPSYQQIKKSKKGAFSYYKSNNSVYFVCEEKQQSQNKYANVVVTVIDLSKRDNSQISQDFINEMVEGAYRLEQKEKQVEKERLHLKKIDSDIRKEKTKELHKKSKTKSKNTTKKTRQAKRKIDKLYSLLVNFNRIMKCDIKAESVASDEYQHYIEDIKLINAARKRYTHYLKIVEKYKKMTDEKKPKSEQSCEERIIKKKIKAELKSQTLDFGHYIVNLKRDTVIKNVLFQENLNLFLQKSLSLKNEGIALYYGRKRHLSGPQDKELFKFAERYKEVFNPRDQDVLFSDFIELISYYQVYLEMNNVFNNDVLLKKERLLLNISKLDFFKEYITDDEVLLKIQNTINFYNVVISKMEELNDDSFYIKDYID